MKYVIESLLKTKAKWLLIIFFITTTISSYLSASIIKWLNYVVTLPTDQSKYVTMIICSFVAIPIIGFCMRATSMYINHMSRYMENRIEEKILKSDIGLFEKFSPSKVARIHGSAFTVGQIVQSVAHMIRCAITFSINIYMVFQINKTYGKWVCIVAIVLSCAFTCIVKLSNKLSKENNETCKKISNEIDDMTNGYIEVHSSDRSCKYHQSRLNGFHDESFKKLYGLRAIYGGTEFLFSAGKAAMTLLILIPGLVLIRDGQTNAAAIITIIMLVWETIDPVFDTVDCISWIIENKPLIKDLDEFMSYENKVLDGYIELDDFTEEITIQDVSFKYESSSSVLSNLNMRIKKGSHIGICGTTGGGKSTLLKLLFRFYDPTAGTISIDGVDIKDYSLGSLHRKIGMVQQSPFMFDDTIRKNITYGLSENISEYEVIEACKKAAIWDFIKGTEDGLETKVGSRGLKLSGGQKQRISLARLFLMNPDILILDEATSALDNITETFIQDALETFHDKTVITVAHRLSTIQNSDKIYVIDNHGIAEEGTHEELLQLHGVYSSMLKQ